MSAHVHCYQCPLILAEFRRHRKVTNPVYVMGFLTQWKMYLDALPQDLGAKNFRKLDPTVFEKVRSPLFWGASKTAEAEHFPPNRCQRNNWVSCTN